MSPAGERIMRVLTPVELAVCTAVCEGKSTKDIGKQFGWKVVTVSARLHEIYDKTGAESRVQLAILLFHHGVIECPCNLNSKLDKALDLIRTGLIECPCHPTVPKEALMK